MTGNTEQSPIRWLTDSEEMKRYDKNTSEHFGIPEAVLMERAALACAQVICERQQKIEAQTKALSYRPGRRVLVMAGRGNNGADGLAVGRLLRQEGFLVDFFLADGRREALSFAAQAQLASALATGLNMVGLYGFIIGKLVTTSKPIEAYTTR